MATLRQESSAVNKGAPSSTNALWGGIIFSLLFTGLIWVVRPLLPQVDFLPDTGASWYYWQLPEQTVMGQITAWVGYLLHQVVIWGTIYYAQRNKLRYTKSLHRVNIFALGANAFFIVLHLFQTAIWYDGLAQDVSIWSSQVSVVIMLVAILLMENQRRGLFFGKKVGMKKPTAVPDDASVATKAGSGLANWGRSVMQDSTYILRKYHGYLFSWGIIYTFWYHPMENTGGHLLGFLYTFLLLVQGSLFFTRAHVNKYWTFTLEFFVLIHGTLVAMQTNTLWPMFFFGFAALFIVTQMYGLGLSNWARWGFIAAYAAAVIVVYSQRGFGQVNEIIRIPFIEYLSVFVLALLIWLGVRLIGLFTRKTLVPRRTT